MLRVALLGVAVCVSVRATSEVMLASFDGTESTTLDWKTVNDPVMGGRSTSDFTRGDGDKSGLGIWQGVVRKVLFLDPLHGGTPGFCTLKAEQAHTLKLSNTKGITFQLRETQGVLASFGFTIQTESMNSGEWAYRADFSASAVMKDYFLAWSDFMCTFRGERRDDCVGLTKELDVITSLGFGTPVPGHEGNFNVEIVKIAAPLDDITIATFDGAKSTMLDWGTMDDPVMGGRSESKLSQGDGEKSSLGIWNGVVRKVWFIDPLHGGSPGFCTLRSPKRHGVPHIPELSGTKGVTVRLRETQHEITDYSFTVQTKSMQSAEWAYRATFSATAVLEDHFMRWSDFVCTERGEERDDCAGLVNELDAISSMGLSTPVPGNTGDFNVEIEKIVANVGGSDPAGLVSVLKATRTSEMRVFV